MSKKRDFKGIWMPAALWEFEGLNITERCFLAEIDSLDHGDGCWAKNEHFAKLFGLSKNRCSEIIKTLLEKEVVLSWIDEDGDRRLMSNLGIEISTEQSKSRQEQSKSRQEQSKSRLPIYKDRDIQLEKQERDTRAIDFLKLNYPTRFESWEMKNKAALEDPEIFYRTFNNKVDTETHLEFTDRVLFARLDTFYLNWIRNNKKSIPVDQVISHPSLRRIS